MSNIPHHSTSSHAQTLFVSPSGSDNWSGKRPEPGASMADGPLATLGAALRLARGLPPGQRRIVLTGGTHFLHHPAMLGPDLSGTTIEAHEDEQVTLIGGRRITGWTSGSDGFWHAALPEVVAGKWDFRMLIVNGRFCTRARVPETGFLTHESEFKVPWMSTTGGGWKRKPTEQELTELRYRPGDLGAWLDLKNAELTVYHMWDESLVGLCTMDEAARTLTFSCPAGHPPGAFNVRKYVVWNTKEGMTQPGQWYLARSVGRVVYWPLPGERLEEIDAIAPCTESILRLEGTEAEPLKDVTVKGLVLCATDTPLVAGGFGAMTFDGAVSVSCAEDVRLADLEIRNVGGQGIKALKATRLAVDKCLVHHTGACGIIAQGADVHVADNLIHDVGFTYPSAIGLRCGGKGIQVVHNTVHDTPYSGIVSGGEDQLFEANRIFRVMEALCDGAGIYITFCKRIVLRANFIHDIRDTGGYGSSAYYLDEQAEDCLVERNLSLRVGRPSHNHMARKDTIRNNVFVAGGDACLTFPRCSDFRFERNVVYAKGKVTFTNVAAIASMPNNVIFSGAGGVTVEALDDYKSVTRSPLTPRDGTLLADPGFVDAEHDDLGFAAGSPALELGIEPVDVSVAGRRSGL